MFIQPLSFSLILSQVVSYVVLLSGVCVEIIMPAGNQSRRKKKKRSDETGHKNVCFSDNFLFVF